MSEQNVHILYGDMLRAKEKQIEGLKKEIEGMRNCFNCDTTDRLQNYLGEIFCEEMEQFVHIKTDCPYWQPKTNKG